MDTDIDTYVDIVEKAKTVFDPSNYELDNHYQKKKKCIEINVKRIRWKNNDIVCCIKAKNIHLFDRW